MSKKARYIPDLNRLMAAGESNYARLLKLMPGFDDHNQWFWGIQLQDGQTGRIRFEITERFKYTTTVCVSQQDRLGEWLQKPSLVVRMYHDASMAEVVDCNNRGQYKGAYAYPNQQMYHSDEKEQLNAYLGEWLSQCMQYGYATEPLKVAGIL